MQRADVSLVCAGRKSHDTKDTDALVADIKALFVSMTRKLCQKSTGKAF